MNTMKKDINAGDSPRSFSVDNFQKYSRVGNKIIWEDCGCPTILEKPRTNKDIQMEAVNRLLNHKEMVEKKRR